VRLVAEQTLAALELATADIRVEIRLAHQIVCPILQAKGVAEGAGVVEYGIDVIAKRIKAETDGMGADGRTGQDGRCNTTRREPAGSQAGLNHGGNSLF